MTETMTEVKIGAATVTRIEESYAPIFDATKFFPDWRPNVVDEHRDWMVSDHYDPTSGFLKMRERRSGASLREPCLAKTVDVGISTPSSAARQVGTDAKAGIDLEEASRRFSGLVLAPEM